MASEPFIKNDKGKARFDLIEPSFLDGLAWVLTLGATKYSPDNWKNCPEPHARYYSALQRHLNAYAGGQRYDAETGVSHLYHAACCTMFLAYFEQLSSTVTLNYLAVPASNGCLCRDCEAYRTSKAFTDD